MTNTFAPTGFARMKSEIEKDIRKSEEMKNRIGFIQSQLLKQRREQLLTDSKFVREEINKMLSEGLNGQRYNFQINGETLKQRLGLSEEEVRE